MKSVLYIFLGLVIVSFFAACGQKKEPTEKEKGKELVEKKLDFAEGAAEALNDKGQPIGRSAGKGVSGLLKGIGSGIMDAVYPPVKVNRAPEVEQAGIVVNKAEEGSSSTKGSGVNMTLAFSKIYKGRIRLHAFDAKGVEMGRATSELLNQPADSVLDVAVYFDRTIRMSNISHCDAHLVEAKTVSLMGDAAPPAEGEEPKEGGAGLELGQMHEAEGTPLVVSQYVIFNKGFKGALQLRAYDATDSEIGRSQKHEDLDQEADSSDTFEFTFHETVTEDSVARYGLHVAASKGAKKKKKNKKKKK